jgi:hypothetical protein
LFGGQPTSFVDDPFDLRQWLSVKSGDPASESVNELIEFGVRNRTVNPSVQLGRAGVVVVAA